MTRWIPPAWMLAIALAAAGVIVSPACAGAARLLFLAGSAAPIGAVLLLAIARLTGADWVALAPIAALVPWTLPAAALAMLAGAAVTLPSHLALWSHPLFVAVRAVAALAALAWAGRRLVRGTSGTVAGVTLAVYAWVATPLASDLLLGLDPGHPVSAAGMMLFVQQIGAACAAALAIGLGGARLRGDLARLLVAAALGLCYLAFVDYLIVWYGNQPARVGFYLARETPAMIALVMSALFLGLVLPIGLLATLPARAQRPAGASALAGLVLYLAWWLGGGLATMLAAGLALLALVPLVTRERPAHG